MKFAAIASTLLLAGSSLAAPGTSMRRERALARRTLQRQSKTLQRVGTLEALETAELTNKTDVSYSSNWAGAVLVGTGYTSVTGTFTVPTPSTAGSGSVRSSFLFREK